MGGCGSECGRVWKGVWEGVGVSVEMNVGECWSMSGRVLECVCESVVVW